MGSVSVEATTLRKLTNRLTYFLSLIYLICFIDRTNVGIAALGMNHDLKLTATAFGLGAGMFYAGYAIFDVPSNLVLHRVGASWWIGRIGITWGLLAAGLGFIQGAHSFYILRFLLGAAEAGFVPGVVYYISLWYPAGHRAKPYAIFMSMSGLAGILMGPLSTWLMAVTNGYHGLAGWRWMFILEGIPSCLLGVVAIFLLTDHPADAKWLTSQEKAWLEETLQAERRAEPPVEHRSVGAFLADKRMWIMVGAYFFWNLGNLGILFWLPTILKSSAYALSGSNQVVGFLYGFFFFCAFIGMYAISWFAHRVGDRSAALLICSVVPFVTLTVSAFTASPILAYVMMCIAAFCIWGLLPIFWTLPAEYMHGRTAAGGIAFISSFSGVGGLFGPWAIGLIRDATGKFPLAIFAMALAFLIQGGFILAMKIRKTGSRVSFLP